MLMSKTVGLRTAGSHNNDVDSSYLTNIEAMKVAEDGWNRCNHAVENTPRKTNVELGLKVSESGGDGRGNIITEKMIGSVMKRTMSGKLKPECEPERIAYPMALSRKPI